MITTRKYFQFVWTLVGLLTCGGLAAQQVSDERAQVVAAHARTVEAIEQGKLEEALHSSRNAYELALATLAPTESAMTTIALSYVNLLMGVGEKSRAHDVLHKSQERIEQNFSIDAVELVPILAKHVVMHKLSTAIVDARKALELHKTHRPEAQLEYAKLATEIGGNLAEVRGGNSEAIGILAEALDIYETEHGSDSVELIPVLMSLGDANARYRKVAGQQRLYNRAIKIAKKSGKEELHAKLLNTAGSRLMQLSASPAAKQYLKKSYQSYHKLFGPDHVRTAHALLGVARFEIARGRPHRAETDLLEALKVFEKDANYRNHELVTLGLLVQSYEELGRSKDATPYCQAIGEVTPWLGDQEYKPIFRRAPKYPSLAVRSRKEGSVLVEYTVDEQGFVRSPKVVEIDGPESFADVSLEAAKAFRYAPRHIDGKPVATAGVTNLFTFKLAR